MFRLFHNNNNCTAAVNCSNSDWLVLIFGPLSFFCSVRIAVLLCDSLICLTGAQSTVGGLIACFNCFRLFVWYLQIISFDLTQKSSSPAAHSIAVAVTTNQQHVWRQQHTARRTDDDKSTLLCDALWHNSNPEWQECGGCFRVKYLSLIIEVWRHVYMLRRHDETPTQQDWVGGASITHREKLSIHERLKIYRY